MDLIIQNIQCRFLPERALFLKDQNMLIIADLHLGKGTILQNTHDLKRLEKLLIEFQPKTLRILGDLFHTPLQPNPIIEKLFRNLLKTSNARLELVIGNHDKMFSKKSPEWIDVVYKKPINEPPCLYAHAPVVDAKSFVFHGHLHPLAAIQIGEKMHLFPTFLLSDRECILPSFSTAATGSIMAVTRSQQLYPIVEGNVFKYDQMALLP